MRGTVQGVGFRFNARAAAQRLGVSGFARNAADGSVEVEVEGDEASVDRMVDWLSHGPRFARVTSLDVSDVPPTGEGGFRVDG